MKFRTLESAMPLLTHNVKKTLEEVRKSFALRKWAKDKLFERFQKRSWKSKPMTKEHLNFSKKVFRYCKFVLEKFFYRIKSGRDVIAIVMWWQAKRLFFYWNCNISLFKRIFWSHGQHLWCIGKVKREVWCFLHSLSRVELFHRCFYSAIIQIVVVSGCWISANDSLPKTTLTTL